MTYYLLQQIDSDVSHYIHIATLDNKVMQCSPNWGKSIPQVLSERLSTHRAKSGNWSPLNEVLAEYQILASSNEPITQQTHPEFFI